jgi:hypothetical protein
MNVNIHLLHFTTILFQILITIFESPGGADSISTINNHPFLLDHMAAQLQTHLPSSLAFVWLCRSFLSDGKHFL